MKFPARQRIQDWRERLSPYGEPTITSTVKTHVDPIAPPSVSPVVPPGAAPVVDPRPRRRAGAGAWLLALGLGAAIAALVVSNLQDPRSLGKQLDDTIRQVRGVGSEVKQTVADSQSAAAQASRQALDNVGAALDDGAISLKVKTALAADPALSAVRIDVNTRQGIVRLDGPAPDAAAKERATVLASAPRGVRGVDNRLALPQPGNIVAVSEPAAGR